MAKGVAGTLVGILVLAAPLGGAADPEPPDVGANGCVACRSNLADARSLYTSAEWSRLTRGDILVLSLIHI